MSEMSISDFKEKLGKRIKQLRKRFNLTQSELALKIGYKDKQVIGRYEKNGANPTAHSLMQIANGFGITLNELVNFDDLDQK